MLTFGGELLGEAIDIAIEKLKDHSFLSLTEIEAVLADRFSCSPGAADRRLRRAMEMTEFRTGVFPNPELEKLRIEYHVNTWSVKKLIYASARRLMKNE